MLLPLPLLVSLQLLVDQLLQRDPHTERALAELDGKVLCLDMTAPPISLYIAVAGSRVNLMRYFDAPVDAVVRGSLRDLVALRDANDGLYTQAVTIDGDLGLANTMKRIALSYDGDWEALLANVVGDDFAHPLAHVVSQFNKVLHRSRDSIEQNVRDYLREESGQLVSDVDVAEFVDGVHATREDVDRLEARIRRLES